MYIWTSIGEWLWSNICIDAKKLVVLIDKVVKGLWSANFLLCQPVPMESLS